MSHEEYKKEAYQNGTFDMGSLNETLKELRDSSFEYLYNLQRELSGYRRFDFKMKDFYKISRNEYAISVPWEFIDIEKRKRFRKSKYNGEWINLTDISRNYDIFSFSYIVIIDGKYMTNVEIKCEETRTLFKMVLKSKLTPNGFSPYQFDSFMKKNADVTIFYVSNDRIDISDAFSSMEKLPNFYKKLTVSKDDPWFQLDIEGMPFPTENMLPFIETEDGLEFLHNIKVKLFYPNIYKVEDLEKDITLCIFYCNDSDILYPFQNELALYYKYTSGILDLYKDNTIPEIIRDYKPKEFIYSTKDFEVNYYGKKTELEYKTQKLKEWIARDSEVVKPYLARQILLTKRFFIKVANITLEDRYRTSNKKEIEEDGIDFETPMYLFTFSGAFATDGINLRFFIDGLFYAAEHIYTDGEYYYFYVPVELIKEDSVIEIERYYNYEFHKEVTFTDEMVDTTFEVKSDKMSVYANDVFLTDRETKYIDMKDNYRVNVDVDGIYLQLSDDSFYNISKAELQLINSALLNKPLDIWIKKVSYYKTQKVLTDADKVNTVYFEKDTCNDPRHFRVFRNGRLIPTQYYNIDFTDYMNQRSAVTINMLRVIGDTFIIDCTPNKYNQIYYKALMDNKGFVDLTGVIDKPVDTNWYDIYVNGRKIRKEQLEIITPTKFFINGINTIKNLDIYEYDRDEEYFSIGDDSTAQLLIDKIESFFTNIYDEHGIITDTEDDILNTLWDDIDLDVLNFYFIYMNRFINPDEDVPEEMIRHFPKLFTRPFFINPDIAPNAWTVLELNGDEPH